MIFEDRGRDFFDRVERLIREDGAPRERFGRYELVELLGRGGMGDVWRAHDPGLGRDVALKILRAADPSEIERFEREARTAAKLSHPNIAAVHEVVADGPRRAIAMQLVEGATLGVHPRTDRRLLVRLLRDAARAVHHAHGLGIIHRDLKPANLMGSADGRVTVLDFGLATSTAADPSISASGTVLGTPAYMPPEQATGHIRDLDARADVYALGATLYELLAGRPPFRGATAFDVLRQVLDEEPRPIGIDRDLETAVMKCLEKDPERRYQTAAAFADDLDAWLRGDPVQARPAGVARRAWRWAARRRAVVTTAALGFVLAAFAGTRWLSARRDLDALQQLDQLWSRVILSKEALRNPAVDVRRGFADIAAAAADVDRYLAEHPDHPQARYVKARALIYLGNFDEAEAVLRGAASFAPARALLGRVLLERYQAGLYGDPDYLADRVALLSPLLEEACHALGEAGASIDQWNLVRTREDEVAEILGQALAARYRDRDATKARSILEEADRRHPSEEYANWLGLFAETPQEQARLQTEAIRRHPHFGKAFLDRAMAHRARNALDAALADFDEALRIKPDNADALINRAIVRGWLRRTDDAVADLDAAAALRPRDALTRFTRGWILYNAGRLDLAAADFDETLRLQPRYHSAYYNLGLIRHARRDFKGAVDAFDACVRLRPGEANLWYTRGWARHCAGDPDGALADYGEAISRQPDHLPSLCNRSMLLRLRGDLDAALRDIEAALRIRADLHEGLSDRGWIRMKRGDVDGALADYDASLEFKPDVVDTLTRRAEARRLKGQNEAAAADLRRALDLAPADWAERAAWEAALRSWSRK